MAAGPALLDVTTGKPANTGLHQNLPLTEQSIGTTGGNTTSVANTNQTQVTNQVQSTSSSSLNTTPQALSALHSLISSLTDRPAISDAELAAKAPMPTAVYSPSGWRWYDPLTGMYMDQQQAGRLTTERQAEQARLSRESGIIKGGTAEQQAQGAERQAEIGRTRTQQAGYTKDAAHADAQALVDKAIADALRTAEPGITLASEGAGTSKSTFRSQQLQEAAVRGGIEGAAQGANLGVAYGQIFTQLEGILEQLTKIDPNGPTAMLLQALQTAKGIAQSGSSTQSTSGVTQTQGTTTTNQQTAGADTKAVARNYDAQPLGGVAVQPMALPIAKPTNPYYAFSMGTTGPGTGSHTVNEPGTFDANAVYQAAIEPFEGDY